uniref:Uncharacterized protein n=1 Tax=Oryza barthii TaxID=65489 RepID=A0A0D3HBG4_9ORYZ
MAVDRGARGGNDGKAAWPGMLHYGRNAEVAVAVVLGACSQATVARSRSDAITARNRVGLGGMEMALKGDDGTDRDDRDSMAMTAFVFNTADREDEGEEDEMEHLASGELGAEEKFGAVDTSWPHNLITACDAANLAASLPPLQTGPHNLITAGDADMWAQPH